MQSITNKLYDKAPVRPDLLFHLIYWSLKDRAVKSNKN